MTDDRSTRLQRYGPGVAIVALAAALRLPWLGVLPNPAGDEGNWTLYALRLLRGQPVALAPEARFVTLAFAHFIALAFRLAGPSFASARAVLVVASLVGIGAVWHFARTTIGPAGAALAAGVLAVHPWAVLWSRSASVPYALDLMLGAVGPLALVSALRARSRVGVVLAGQILAVGVYFSPLALLPMAACGLWVLRPAVRTQVSAGTLVVAALLGAVHLVPLALGVRTALGAGGHHVATVQPWLPRFGCFVRMVVGELSGEATAAHFAGHIGITEVLGAIVTVTVAAIAIPHALRHRPLGSLAVTHLAVALVGLPLLLLPGRDWHMPTIDAERYGFALLAPFALVVGSAAARPGPGPGRVAACVFALWLLCVPTLRTGANLATGWGGSDDQGLEVMHEGGRYRGWRAAAGNVSLPERIRAEASQRAGSEAATIVYEDYAFHPVRFVNAVAGGGRIGTSLGWTPMQEHRLEFTVVWSDGVFAPGYEPRSVPVANRALRARVMARGGRQVVVIQGRSGAPLCELWQSR